MVDESGQREIHLLHHSTTTPNIIPEIKEPLETLLSMLRASFKSLKRIPLVKMVPISTQSLQQIPLSYASCSIGCGASDTLPRKLEAISQAGFLSIELSFPDILEYGSQLLGHSIEPENFSELIPVAGEIRKLCDANALTVMMLQPFANFEGWPQGSIEREDAFARAKGWISIMKVVGTDLLQVRYSILIWETS